MKPFKIAAAQFEHRSLDKEYNLGVIDAMSAEAATAGADTIAFHECCITGYTVARTLNRNEMLELAEPVDGGPSIRRLSELSKKNGITILAGLFERDDENRIYNTYVCADKNGPVASHRKLHPFIHPDLSAGNSYTLFELNGWTCGILICYDNNIPENVRATNLLGADIIFMPHVTMCTPSTRPGAGFVDPALWKNRKTDPTSLRAEFNGLKGREWLMKWLPSRAYDNAAYVVFTNPIGMDHDQLKNGCSMILDPFGDILAECTELGDDMILAEATTDKLNQAGGYRYKNARRTDLYREVMTSPHTSSQRVAWLDEDSE
ncbi:nitrilase family protein [Rhodohalobacter mucosus]|uniref:Nitrilase n=1 Tax=Rhodohalobacter mucosus TaxID=2079485 RepID=A0A316TUJ4_9BACT|nr:nitrilase family protein [Rhodohalobacter mucosus]PWN07371.1 nitrilase [Rhodohalobacter mucosus]